jgi:putative ABC transport system permease protein
MMLDSLAIAGKYLLFYKVRSWTLIACITLIAFLPFSLQILLKESERQLTERAEQTPMLVGAKGSALDLVMSNVYFSEDRPETIPYSAVGDLYATGLAEPIPLYVRFRARGFPVIGTTPDYLDYRGIEVARGRSFLILGECVLGHAVAEQLGLGPGDKLTTSPESVFDLAGVYPLKMSIAGILAPQGNADDMGVFVDLHTAWIIQGLAHGHQDVARINDPTLIIDRSEGNVTANAKLVQYNEITPDNIDSFHFHGDVGQFPVSGVLAVTADGKSGTILRGRYLDRSTDQLVRPPEIVASLMENIFRIRNILDAGCGDGHGAGTGIRIVTAIATA